jgi:lipopolysaccharide export system permease protein
MERENPAQQTKRTKKLPIPRTLDRFVLAEMAGPFVSGILIFTMIFVAGDLLFQAARLVIERGVSFGVVVRLFVYRLPEVIGLTLPMSCLLSTLLSTNRMSRDSELVALKSLGVSFRRILRPVMGASFLIAASALAFNETVVDLKGRAVFPGFSDSRV